MRTIKRQAAMITALLMMAMVFSVLMAPTALALDVPINLSAWSTTVTTNAQNVGFNVNVDCSTLLGGVATITSVTSPATVVTGATAFSVPVGANYVGSMTFTCTLSDTTSQNVTIVVNPTIVAKAPQKSLNATTYYADFSIAELYTIIGNVSGTPTLVVTVSPASTAIWGFPSGGGSGIQLGTGEFTALRYQGSSTTTTDTVSITGYLKWGSYTSNTVSVPLKIVSSSSLNANAVTLNVDMGTTSNKIFSRSRDVSGTTTANTEVRILSDIQSGRGQIKYGSEAVMINYPYLLNNIESFNYVPPDNWVGTTSFTYQVIEGLDQPSNTVTINVRPLAANDSYSVPMNVTFEAPSTQYLMANDKYPTGSSATVTIKTNPSYGTLTLLDASKGSFRYVPTVSYNGTDSFTYVLTSNGVESGVATVTLKIGVTTDFTTSVDPVNGFSVLANNGLLAGYGPNYSIMSNANTSSNFTLYSDGAFTFRPPTGESGIFPLQYTLVNNNVSPPTYTAQQVNIAVKPRGTNSTYDTPNNYAYSLTSTDARTKNLGSNLRATVTHNPQYGTLNMLTDGSFTYTPNSGFVGTDTFRYKLTDTDAYKNGSNTTLDSDEITVTMRVAAASLIPEESDLPTLPPTGESESIDWMLYCLGAAVVIGGLYVLYIARKRMAKK